MTSPDGDRTARPSDGTARTDAAGDVSADLFQAGFRDTPYYSTGRTWTDYEPAYRYAIASHGDFPGQRFEDVESALEDGWQRERQASRLVWSEAQGCVRAVWQQLGLHPLVPAGDPDRSDDG